MNNIILIGMPASGKSTIGVILAKTLGMQFVDTDLIIQQREGSLLQNIIDKKGIDTFLKAEESAIKSSTFENSVIATGGSAVYSQISMEKLHKEGIIIYLRLPFAEIEKRLKNIKTRGVAIKKEQTRLIQILCKPPKWYRIKISFRRNFYEKKFNTRTKSEKRTNQGIDDRA